MKINKNNYEAYFLDYHEGNLSPEEVTELLLFVEQYPDLKEELESFENFTIEDYSSITFENKSSLKKEITDENREEYFIKAVENNLNSAEKALLENYLKQHPQFLVDYNLFQKTKVEADASIVFEKKDAMKKDLTPSFSTGNGNAGEALISLMEGLLSEEESTLMNEKINADTRLQKEFALYKQTKLTADTSIVFENKESLKRKERKVIPIFYYIATAAAVLLLVGLYFLNNNNNGQQFSEKKANVITNQVANNAGVKLNDKTNTKESNAVTPSKTNTPRVPNKQLARINKVNKENKLPVSPVNNSPVLINNQESNMENKELIAENKEPQNKKDEPVAENKESTARNTEPATNKEEYLTLKEMAVAKIKETTMDKKSLDEEKKAGRLKRFSGWDLAKVAAKGINTLTGSNVKVEPKYNENGDVEAYAVAAGGFAISRGR